LLQFIPAIGWNLVAAFVEVAMEEVDRRRVVMLLNCDAPKVVKNVEILGELICAAEFHCRSIEVSLIVQSDASAKASSGLLGKPICFARTIASVVSEQALGARQSNQHDDDG
jgi:hypothetical protein